MHTSCEDSTVLTERLVLRQEDTLDFGLLLSFILSEEYVCSTNDQMDMTPAFPFCLGSLLCSSAVIFTGKCSLLFLPNKHNR